MAEKENIKERFTAGQTVKFMLSEFNNHFVLEECSVYVRKTEDGKWELFGLCTKRYSDTEDWEDKDYAFCAKLAPKISNAVFWSIHERKEKPINSVNYMEIFSSYNGFYFFPVDGFYLIPEGKKFKCGFMSYEGIFFDIDEDCNIEFKQIPRSIYDEIDASYPYDGNN